MKYRVEVNIKKPRTEVSNALRDKDAALKWIKGLKSFELIKGQMEEVGSQYEMVFNNNGKESKMIETITSFDSPNKITTVYTMNKVWNECINNLHEKEMSTTYVMDVVFKFGFPMNLFIWAFKPFFKKESLKGLNDFKNYVEKEL